MPKLRSAVLLIAVAAGTATADAQVYPSRPITIVVPYSAGGPTDTIARIMAERMRAPLGQTIIVDNVTGAAGTIGVGKVARAAADGYTIVIGHWGTHVVNGAIYALAYDVLRDFEPVAMIATNPQLIVAKKAVPAQDLQGLIAWLKANSATATQGTAGHGSASHISGVYFQNSTGARFQFVPYRGAGPAMQDLVAGQVDLMIDQAANSLPQVRAGHDQGLCSDRQDSAAGRARHSNRGRGRRAGPAHRHLAWALDAESNTERYHRQAQCGGCRDLGRCRRAPEARTTRPGDSGPRAADAAGAVRLSPSRD